MGAPKQILLPSQFSTGKPRALQGPGMFSLCLASQHHPRHRTRSPDPHMPHPTSSGEVRGSKKWGLACCPGPTALCAPQGIFPNGTVSF